MKIIDNNNILLHYSLDPTFFEKHSEISKSYTTESYWRNIEANTAILTYTIFYSVKDLNKTDYLINYKRRLLLKCLFENAETDANEVIKIKESMHLSLDSFLKQNTSFYYASLNFHPLKFSDMDKKIEKAAIERIENDFNEK